MNITNTFNEKSDIQKEFKPTDLFADLEKVMYQVKHERLIGETEQAYNNIKRYILSTQELVKTNQERLEEVLLLNSKLIEFYKLTTELNQIIAEYEWERDSKNLDRYEEIKDVIKQLSEDINRLSNNNKN